MYNGAFLSDMWITSERVFKAKNRFTKYIYKFEKFINSRFILFTCFKKNLTVKTSCAKMIFGEM